MKIAILADSLDNQNAGVHVYTKSLVQELVNRNDGNQYILVRQKRDKTLTELKQIVVPNTRLPIGFASLRLFFIIPFILQREKVDVVFEPAHFGPFNVPKKIKRVTFIHDLTPIKFPEYHRWHSQLLQRLFLKRILTNTHLIITNSANTRRDLIEYYPFTKDKSNTILLGKDPIYKPIIDENIISYFKIDTPYFLYVGTIEPRKNMIRLLDAFTRFMDRTDKSYTLVIAGGFGWKTQQFKQVLATHPYLFNIKMIGYVTKEKLPALYSQSQAVIYPSIYEGFGFPVLEAMACGVPVICSNTSSIPEVGGDVVFYFDPTSVEELKNQMIRVSKLYPEERTSIKLKSVNRSQLFSWKKHVDSFLKSINSLFN